MFKLNIYGWNMAAIIWGGSVRQKHRLDVLQHKYERDSFFMRNNLRISFWRPYCFEKQLRWPVKMPGSHLSIIKSHYTILFLLKIRKRSDAYTVLKILFQHCFHKRFLTSSPCFLEDLPKSFFLYAFRFPLSCCPEIFGSESFVPPK